MRMKILITAIAVLMTFTGCAGSSLEKMQDGNLTFFVVESGVGLEGGPVMKSIVVAETDDSGKHKVLYRDTHSSPGTGQQLANTTVGGGLAIIREKERAPFSVSGDNTTTFNVDGGNSQAAAMSESSTETDVDINTDSEEEDVSYEISDDYE